MTAQEGLSTYIAECRKKAVSDLIIRDNLLHAGWSKEIVDRALAHNLPIPLPEEQDKGSRSMWDAFEHVLLFISLYVFSISTGSVFYVLINTYIPQNKYGYDYYAYDSMTSPLAAVLVSFPIFLYFFNRISKRTALVPIVRSLPVRKFLIYATLVVAFVVALVNLSGLVYNLLSGDLTVNLFLKSLVVLTITGTVAAYYLIQTREDARISEK